jgi:hypothetical protein
MLRYTTLGLAAVVSLSLAALSPARADIPACMSHPNADTCPTMGAPTPPAASQQVPPRALRHTHYRYEPVQKQKKG